MRSAHARAVVRAAAAAASLGLVAGMSLVACAKTSRRAADLAADSVRAPSRDDLVEIAYDGALKNGWQDWGWSPRKTTGPGPAEVHFANWGGLILARPGLESAALGALEFHVKEPTGEGEFLEVRVESSAQTTFPRIKIGAEHRADVGDGWVEVKVPMWQLDPDAVPFDRIIFHAFREVGNEVTLFDRIGFAKGDPDAGAAARLDPTAYSRENTHKVTAHLACDAKATHISPYIYGIAYNGHDADAPQQWQLGTTARRWGGNNTTRYNWQIDAWNLDFDWFFENIGARPYTKYIDEDIAHNVASFFTVPIMGWVAKDTTSNGFPVSVFGPQGRTDPYRKEAGDGTRPGTGEKIPPGPPTQTSIAITPDWDAKWIQAIRAADAKRGKRSITEYILDNEPAIWSTTHRDVRTEPLGYDELVDRTIQYGSAVRKADPEAVIAGPADWGWPAYEYSAKDAAAGFLRKPDRRAHDDVPFIEWYLRKLREHEEKTGERVLDVVDEHYYPQADGVCCPGGTDAQTIAKRLRSTRSLWDPDYADESWVKEKVRLLPRMKDWIARNYPGRGIQIGEWNFGGDGNISGALASAEALGRYAQFGVYAAFYWQFPSPGSPTIQAWAAYRNFDGKGGHFLDWYVPSTVPEGSSLFVSRDEAGTHAVAVAINLSPDAALLESLDASACGQITAHHAYTYVRGATGFVASSTSDKPGPVELLLPPYSLVVVDLQLSQPMKGALEK